MLADAERSVNRRPDRASFLLAVAIVGRLFGGDAVIAFEPAAEIDLRATG
jgi:hypothetical protein